MRINEIFYSIQGEGHFTGTPAVFVRLSGCNLKCWFCDTQHTSFLDMTEQEIVASAMKFPSRHVILTGGEPTLQLTASLVKLFHEHGFFVQMETNGTKLLPDGADIDWVTCSPKKDTTIIIQKIDELKVVLESENQNMAEYENIHAKEYRLQPCDTGDSEKNSCIIDATVKYVMDHPKWKLSLQTHKILNIR